MASDTAAVSHRERLLATIRTTLEAGVRLMASDMAFIASAWDVSLPGDLPGLLADPADWGAESLVALVFSADDAACQQLLPAVQASALTIEDTDWLVADLTAAPPTITGRLPDGTTGFTMPMPEAGIRRFVETLRPSRRIPAALFTLLTGLLPDHRRAPILSRLRLSRVPWNGTTPDLLERFCKRLGRADDVDALLEILIAVLETTPSQSAEDALARRKRACFRALTEADRFTENAGRHNMETLMMMGVRPPLLSGAEARRQMNRIDRVSMALFDRTEAIAPEAMSVAQAAIDSTDAAMNSLALIDGNSGKM
ncbi:MAG: hypothetical protein ABIL58_01180 [Pseudomonadota bacterium]